MSWQVWEHDFLDRDHWTRMYALSELLTVPPSTDPPKKLVPEPSSLLLWLGLFSGVGVCRLRSGQSS
ncbi:MAG: hypothetical protein CMJ48_10260 [Planctomycetaceae bacterium]|nr:hypothetical protein [Planctomycetaceae bacterium]